MKCLAACNNHSPHKISNHKIHTYENNDFLLVITVHGFECGEVRDEPDDDYILVEACNSKQRQHQSAYKYDITVWVGGFSCRQFDENQFLSLTVYFETENIFCAIKLRAQCTCTRQKLKLRNFCTTLYITSVHVSATYKYCITLNTTTFDKTD